MWPSWRFDCCCHFCDMGWKVFTCSCGTFQDALEMESEKQLLQRFISEAQELRVIRTVRSDFKTPVAWCEAWACAACNLFKAKQCTKSLVKNGLGFLGRCDFLYCRESLGLEWSCPAFCGQDPQLERPMGWWFQSTWLAESEPYTEFLWLPWLAEWFTYETSDFWVYIFKVKIPESVGLAGFRQICSGTSAVDLDHICIVPSRSVEEQETKLARAMFLLAVSWTRRKGKPQELKALEPLEVIVCWCTACLQCV